MIPVPPTTSQMSSESRVALEIYYDILKYVECKHELAKLAHTASPLQRPAESRLYEAVALHGERDLRGFQELLKSAGGSRIGGLVKRISYSGIACGGGDRENNVSRSETAIIRDVLGNLQALQELCIEGAVRWNALEVLGSISSHRLTILRCSSLDFDVPSLEFLRGQNCIQELHVQCTFPENTSPLEWGCILDSLGDKLSQGNPRSPSAYRLVLPNLRALRTNSLSLAMALIPYRPLSHLWVTETNDFGSTPSLSSISSSTSNRATTAEPWGTQDPQQHSISPASDSTPRETCWCDLFHELAEALPYQTSCEERPRSLRLNFGNVPRVEARDILRGFAKFLGPTIRTLGFLNRAAVEELLNWPDTEDVVMFKHLHTIALDYTPSVAVVERLARSSAFPAIRTVACYGFSRSFEYLCIPANDTRGCSTLRNLVPPEASGWSADTGDVEWVTDLRGYRLATPIHDPDYRLWLDA